jgi:hypothetical protein
MTSVTSNLTGLNNSSSAFDGMLIYQDRSNSQDVKMTGNTGSSSLKGTVYAPDANIDLAGNGNWGAQFITSTVSISGNGTLTLNYAGSDLGKAPFVFMVE